MIYQYPAYYFDFQCINRDCPDTCCGGWNIPIDSVSLKRYRRILRGTRNTASCQGSSCDASSQAFLRRFQKSIDFDRSLIRLTGRYCPLLTKEKLCGMYLHLGKDSLCRTCRTYPRHQEDFGSLKELSLSLSCPEAARIILSQKTRLQMQTRQTAKKCPPGRQVEEDLLAWLIKVREVLLDILWKPGCSLEAAASMALVFSHTLQCRYSLGRYSHNGRFCLKKACKDLEHLSKKVLADNAGECLTKKLLTEIPVASAPLRSAWRTSLLNLYSGLEPVVASWPQLMKLCQNIQTPHKNQNPLQSTHQNTHQNTSQASPSKNLRKDLRLPEKQLLTYFIQVYFLGSIYDDNLFDKVQFAVLSWLATDLLAESLAGYIGFQTSESVPDSFLIQAAYLYSRQTENSDRNLNAVFHSLHTHKYFRLIPFLTFLNSCNLDSSK